MYNFEALSKEDRKEMLEKIGIKSTDEIFDIIPKSALMEALPLEEGKSELEAQKDLKKLSQKNKTDYISFLGAGSRDRFVPSLIQDIASRFEFLSCYTPYQAEISQGSLEVMYEFQSLMCTLTQQDVSNATVYDGASACAEAILMASRLTKKRKVFVKDDISDNYLEVIKTYLWANGIELIVAEESKDTDLCAKLYQTPNKFGEIIEMPEKNANELIISCVDLMSLALIEPPKSDITVGDIQSFGIGLNFGGAYAGFISCLDKYKRQLPGRISGKTLDKNGKTAYCLTLQAREQHIRREKATSNICSNQALVAFCANLYLRKLGKTGLLEIAQNSYDNAHLLKLELEKIGLKVQNKDFFDEFTIIVENAGDFIKTAKKEGILAGKALSETQVLISASEKTTKEEIDCFKDFCKKYFA